MSRSHFCLARAATIALLAASAASLSGCYRVSIKSGRDAAAGPPATDGASRGGLFNGIDEDEPLHMGMACNQGWSSVEIETSFLNGLVNAARGLVYHTENVTLRCAPEPGAPANVQAKPPSSGGPPENAVASPAATPSTM